MRGHLPRTDLIPGSDRDADFAAKLGTQAVGLADAARLGGGTLVACRESPTTELTMSWITGRSLRDGAPARSRQQSGQSPVDEFLNSWVCWREACEDVRGSYERWRNCDAPRRGSPSRAIAQRSTARTRRRASTASGQTYSTSTDAMSRQQLRTDDGSPEALDAYPELSDGQLSRLCATGSRDELEVGEARLRPAIRIMT